MKKILSTLQDKWAEYLIEVTVIILGIWGAFALESWNDSRDKLDLEIKILKEIRDNISKDFNDHDLNLEHLRNMSHGADQLLLFIDTKEVKWTDSLSNHLGNLTLFPDFNAVKSGYELMTSNPEIQIQNDSIRKNISYLYGNSHSWMEKKIDYNQRNSTKYYNDILSLIIKDFKYVSFVDKNNKGDVIPGLQIFAEPENMTTIKTNKELRSVIFYHRAQINFFIMHYSRRLRLAYSIIDQLNEEISRLEVL